MAFDGALCVGKTDVFFGRESEKIDARVARERQAKALCSLCPARDDCLATAIANDERHGIWGGLNPDERKAVARAARAG